MDRRNWIGVAIVVLLAGPACSNGGAEVHATPTPIAASSPTPIAASSPTPTAEASPTPTVASTPSPPAPADPVVSCTTTPTSTSQPLLLAATPGNQTVLLESLSDPAHPSTLCTLSGGDFRFISPILIGYRTTSSSNDPIHGTSVIGVIDLIDLKPVAHVSVQGDVLDFAWSRDGSSLAYLLYTDVPGTGAVNQLWLATGKDQPRTLTPRIPLFGRDGSVDDENIVRFSSDGHYLLMVDTFVAGAAPASSDQAVLQVHSVPDGALVWVPPSALDVSGFKFGPYITMAAWAHQSDRLYYRDSVGVHTWEPPTTVATFANGAPWRWPSLSSDDSLLAYELPALSSSYVEVRNLVTGSKQGWSDEAMPRLLSDDELIDLHVGAGWFVRNLSSGVAMPLPENARPIDAWPR